MFQKFSKILFGNSAAQEEAAVGLENEGGAPRADCPPMSNLRYEYTTNLQYKVRSLGARVKAFETGEKYTEMKAGFKKQLAEKDKSLEKTRRLYEAETELEEEKGRNQKLKAQISRDHENSSKSSSTIPNRKKITNNRESTGRKPGAQPGHEGHGRKWHEPTGKIEIPVPEEYTNPSLYTGE